MTDQNTLRAQIERIVSRYAMSVLNNENVMIVPELESLLSTHAQEVARGKETELLLHLHGLAERKEHLADEDSYYSAVSALADYLCKQYPGSKHHFLRKTRDAVPRCSKCKLYALPVGGGWPDSCPVPGDPQAVCDHEQEPMPLEK